MNQVLVSTETVGQVKDLAIHHQVNEKNVPRICPSLPNLIKYRTDAQDIGTHYKQPRLIAFLEKIK